MAHRTTCEKFLDISRHLEECQFCSEAIAGLIVLNIVERILPMRLGLPFPAMKPDPPKKGGKKSGGNS